MTAGVDFQSEYELCLYRYCCVLRIKIAPGVIFDALRSSNDVSRHGYTIEL